MENTQIGPFLILEKLGTSRRQKVYRARQTKLGREFALKFLSIPPQFDRRLALEKLNHEFQVLRALRHPNLVRSYGAGIEGDQIFWATELIDGESLASILSRRGRIAPDQVVEFARQVALCLQYLHSQNLIHSKLTPEKLLIDRTNTVHVADLRLNRSKKRRWDSMKHRDAELAAYLAPEQLTGYATHKSDIYSLGTIMYEMLTGHLPFPPDNIARMTRRKLEDRVEPVATQILTCPIWLDKLVTQMIDPAPRKRPHSAQAVRMALEEIARIDATKRSVMDELSGAFNPLHLNIDKTEARELMAKSKGERPKSKFNWIEFSALAGSFLALILVILLFLREKPTEVILKNADQLVMSTSPSDWSTARELLGGVLKRPLSDENRKEANRLFLTAQRQTLRNWGERQIRNGLQSKAVQNFVEAYGDEQSHRFQTAYRKYEGLERALGESSSEPEVYYEALAGTDRLERLHALPDGDEGISDWLELHRDVDSIEELEGCVAIGKDLLEHFGNSPSHAELRDRTTMLMDQWNERLMSHRTDEE